MAGKFFGKIGFGESVEVKPGRYEEQVVEHEYYGDVLRNARGLSLNDSVLPNITADNSISIVADAYANEHYYAMRYVEWQGVLWTISKVAVAPPRLNLTLGEVYNGPRPNAAPEST